MMLYAIAKRRITAASRVRSSTRKSARNSARMPALMLNSKIVTSMVTQILIAQRMGKLTVLTGAAIKIAGCRRN